ncbi:hypothetical protein AB0L06_27395 [Spirillospora sp. NPDC052269]
MSTVAANTAAVLAAADTEAATSSSSQGETWAFHAPAEGSAI